MAPTCNCRPVRIHFPTAWVVPLTFCYISLMRIDEEKLGLRAAAMAHRAALASHGMTVAFLAGGVDRFYPAGHDALLTRMVSEGAILSELPCGQPPTKWRFLQRNRLIAAASQATVVVEAGWRSGSLNTAGHAAEIGRPVGAVPGPVTSAALTVAPFARANSPRTLSS